MRIRPDQYIAVSQLVLGLCLFICLLLIPRYFFSLDQGGVSNYGTEDRTIGLYTIGFGVAAIGTLFASLKLPVHTPRLAFVRLELLLLSVLYATSLLSTYQYKLNDGFRLLHEQAAIALFVGMLLVTVWLRFVFANDSKTRRAFIIFCVGFLAAALTLSGFLHVLFTAQLISGISFAYILVRGVSILNHRQQSM